MPVGAQLGGVKNMQMQLAWVLCEVFGDKVSLLLRHHPCFVAYLSNVTLSHVLTTPAEFQTGRPKRISQGSARLLVGGVRCQLGADP